MLSSYRYRFSSDQPVWIEMFSHSCSSKLMLDTSARTTNHHFFTWPSRDSLYLRFTDRYFTRDFGEAKRSIAFNRAAGVVDLRVPHTFFAFVIKIWLLDCLACWVGVCLSLRGLMTLLPPLGAKKKIMTCI